MTATAVERNPRGVNLLADAGLEIAGHGDIHEGFLGSTETQVRRLRSMNQTFGEVLGFVPRGFRAPFLRHDANLYQALASMGFAYDSSRTFQDPLLCLRYAISRRKPVYDASIRSLPRVLRRHVSGDAVPRPRTIAEGVVELPVFELDDWFFFDYADGPLLGVDADGLVPNLWHKAWEHCSRRGDLFVMQAHPQRMAHARLRIIEEFVERGLESGARFLTLLQAVDWVTRRDEKARTTEEGR